nr:S-methyl-5-thioribose-1-phosphate isomerase [uncultured Roseateles sp.]
MRINGEPWRTIWCEIDGAVGVIDQRALPHYLETQRLTSCADVERAIRDMWVRGAPLIGAAAAYGLALAMREDSSDAVLTEACTRLLATRPTAVNLRWALDRLSRQLRPAPAADRMQMAYLLAAELCNEDVAINQSLGHHGLALIKAAAARHPGRPLNILTHCNAGWLATVDWGTATAAIYQAFDAGIALHVWVDETRPRNQGASLTAWELGQHGVPHSLIVDNAGGHLMQHGRVDLCIVGADRVTAQGDVCNKIGTYLKALAAHDNDVPFYVAMPSPTLDLRVSDGLREITIENRAADEISMVSGIAADGRLESVRIAPHGSACDTNPGFDVTPARLITGLITERGVCAANRAAIAAMFGTAEQHP